MTRRTAVPLRWRLHTVMSERGIRTSSELHRRLEPYGIDITSHQLSRIVAKLPLRLNTQVLAALMTELKCEATDLLVADAADDKPLPEALAGKPSRARRKKNATVVSDDILGPNITQLPRRGRPDGT